MEKLTEVFAMGGYAAYVWPSFLLTALVLAGMIAASIQRLRVAQRILCKLQSSSGDEA